LTASIGEGELSGIPPGRSDQGILKGEVSLYC
jgi:hypothetical protein